MSNTHFFFWQILVRADIAFFCLLHLFFINVIIKLHKRCHEDEIFKVMWDIWVRSEVRLISHGNKFYRIRLLNFFYEMQYS